VRGKTAWGKVDILGNIIYVENPIRVVTVTANVEISKESLGDLLLEVPSILASVIGITTDVGITDVEITDDVGITVVADGVVTTAGGKGIKEDEKPGTCMVLAVVQHPYVPR
jgi:hypothetical protein